MKSKVIHFRVSVEDIEKIDKYWRNNKFKDRSSFINEKLLSFENESVSIYESKLNDIDLKLNKFEKAIVDIKKNELTTINRGYKLLISFVNILFKCFIKISLHQINVKKMTQSEVDELLTEYTIPERNEKVSYPEFKLFELRNKLQNK